MKRGCWWGLPSVIYLVAFCAMTWPAILSFNTHFFCDAGDGLQNVWNIWWVRKAILELHQSPWWTTWLHYPYGTTLLGHTLSPFNGLLAIPLSTVLSQIQTYNALVILAFVLGGWTAFLLAHDVIGAYWPSVVAGFAFTFSGYHFAHAEGHLNLVSLQWVPLFVLCWLRLLREPSVKRGLWAAATLALVILCDYYYFAYCVALGLLTSVWRVAETRDPFVLLRDPFRRALAAFVLCALVTSGLLAIALLIQSARDPFVGVHDPAAFSTDLLAPFVPGGHSAYRKVTESYWSSLRGNIEESNVYLGLTVVALAAWGFVRGRNAGFRDRWMWLVLALVFFVASLGPRLVCGGRTLMGAHMPYALLEWAFPPLRLSGCPVRMMVVVALAVSVMAGAGLNAILRQKTKGRFVFAILAASAVGLDLLPRAMTLTRPEVPEWVYALRASEGPGGLLDLSGTNGFQALYYQTIHGKPMAGGFVSRYSAGVLGNLQQMLGYVQRGDFDALRDIYGFRYVVTRGAEPPVNGGAGQGSDIRVYDLRRTIP